MSNKSDVTVTHGMPICGGIEQSKWTGFNCSDKKHFMCYKDNNYILIENEKKIWCQAQLYCRRYFTDLVSISNEMQNTQVIEEGKNKTFWIGLLHDEWEWVDNSCSTFRDWDSDVSNQSIKCSALSNSNMSMAGAECDDEDKPTFCSKGKVRIQVVRLNLTWEKAFNYCADNHTSLLQIEDSEDQRAVEQWLNHTSGDGPFWIGLRQSRVFGFWIWCDKTVYYSHWKDGRQPEMPMSDNCGVIDKTDYTWRDENCWHEHPFICEEEISFMNK
ncbi:macrophage mannose receptor 1-like [Seriola dumerili]|uniref:macrophage mannose receptor 1-like n=1 Tax=Seriola dumerili TaxID=41447 RepID=UPI000BBE4126|nr:macrophage mannose receptor 1-like [Seriola dumerili]